MEEKLTEKKVNTIRYKIQEIPFIKGDAPIVKRHNNYAHILILKNQINDLIKNYFHGEVSYVYDSYDRLLKYPVDSDDLLAYWVKFYERLFDRIPEEKKVPRETRDMTEALDSGIFYD